jgi:phage protein D
MSPAAISSIYIPQFQVFAGTTNLSGNLTPHMLSVKYNESMGGKASTFEIQLEDSTHAFQNNPPAAGLAVSLAIGYQGMPLTSCGNFEVDEWASDGPPDTFTLKGVQAGITHALRSPKSMAYEGQTLSSIATTIANRYGMTVLIDAVDPDVVYARLTQRTESDLGFLHRIANAHDYEFKVRGNQLYFYGRTSLDSAAPSVPALDKTDVIRYKIRQQHIGKKRSYASAVTTHFDPLSKKLLTALATDPNATSVDTLHIIERIENQQQGALRAQSHLHAANMHQIKASMTIPGTMAYRSGNTVMLTGFGKFDTVKFIIEEAKHKLEGSGYTTDLELRTTVTATGSTQIISDEDED